MKHKTKKMLISALILFCAGLLLTTGGYIAAAIGSVGVYETKERPEPDIRSETYSVSQFTGGDTFHSLDIRFQVGNVVITKVSGAAQTTVQVSEVDMATFTHKVTDGVLVLADDDDYPSSYFGFSFTSDGFTFNGLRQILNFSSAANSDRTLYINLASDVDALESINISCGAGDVILRNFSVKDNVRVAVSCGDVRAEKVEVGSAMTLNTDLGDVAVSECSYTRCEVASTKGNITAYITGEGNGTFESVAGDVLIESKNALQNYEITLSATVGSVSVGETEIGSDYTHYPDSHQKSFGKIIATAVVGSVNISQKDATTPSPV